jgi:hypothetical protein
MSCLYPEIGEMGLPNPGQTDGQEGETKTNGEFGFPCPREVKIFQEVCS